MTDERRLQREIEHHRKIADRAEVIWNWDSPAGRVRARRRAELFVERGELGPGKRALELGCGTGIFLAQVARSGATVVGLDLTPEILARAGTRVREFANVTLLRGNAERSPFPDRAFDTVYGSSILHHLHLPRALAEAFRVLRPGGRIVFAEPNLINPQVYVSYIRPFREFFGQSMDEMAFTRFHARRVLAAAGFTRLEVRPFDFVHPALPPALIPTAAKVGRFLERLPLTREIAGSMLITASRP